MAGASLLSPHGFFLRPQGAILSPYFVFPQWLPLGEAHFLGKPQKGLPEKRRTRISMGFATSKAHKRETQGKHFYLVFREIVTYFRHLETTPFCPADIFPREGARSYRRMGIIAIIFSAPASPLPLHGECRRDRRPEGESQRVGKRGLFSVFRWRNQIFQTQVQ